MTRSRHGRRPLGAYLDGMAAAWAFGHLEAAARSSRAHYARAGRLDYVADIDRAIADLKEAARQWHELEQDPSAPGTAEAPTVPAVAGSVTEALPREAPAEIDSRAAADALGVTPRRVGQMCSSGRLRGRKDRTGRWHVDPDDLTRLIADRKLSA